MFSLDMTKSLARKMEELRGGKAEEYKVKELKKREIKRERERGERDFYLMQ